MIEPGHVVAPLSVQERDVLRLIARVYDVLGEPPSQRALARRLDLTLPRVQRILQELYRKGWLRVPDPAGLRCTHIPQP